MKKRFVFAFCLSSMVAAGQGFQDRVALKQGPHSVGFKIDNRYDRGRYVRPKMDFEGRLNEGEGALPVQISIWYPAVDTPNEKKILFEEYVYFTQQKNSLKPLSEKEKQDARDILKFPAKFGANMELKEDQLTAIMKTPTAAVLNARNAKGSFPVIIAGADGGPNNHSVLFEYLASHGYVVLFTPSVSSTGTLQANKPQVALDQRIGSLEFLFDYAHSLPFADCSRLGFLGGNFDGMSAILLQMKCMQADAVVSMDGWEGKIGSESTLIESAFFNVNKFRTPFFTVLQDEQAPPPYLALSQNVFDKMVYSDRYYYVLRDMSHTHLVSNLIFLPGLDENKLNAYNFIYTSIGKFFDAYIKKSSDALTYLKTPAVAKGYKTEIIKKELTAAAAPPVPTSEEFEKIIMNEQFDKAIHIVREGRKFNPALSLFDLQSLDLYSFRFTQRKKPESVLSIRKLGVEAFPESALALKKLGDAYIVMSDTVQAKAEFEKAVALIDRQPKTDGEGLSKLRDEIIRTLTSLAH